MNTKNFNRLKRKEKRRPHRHSCSRKGINKAALGREILGLVRTISIAGTQPQKLKSLPPFDIVPLIQKISTVKTASEAQAAPPE